MKKLILAISICTFILSCSDEDGLDVNSKQYNSAYSLSNSYDESGGYTSEDYEDYGENTFIKTSLEPTSTFAIDADGGSYSNARRFLNLGQLPPTASVRVEEFVNYFQYNYPTPSTENVSFQSEVATCPWYASHYLLKLGLKGMDIPESFIAGSNFVFLIDVSGSMKSPDKLELLKSGFKMLVEELDETDKVSIVTYAGSAGVILAPTPCSEKQTIEDAINSLGAGGSTAGAQGIITAYDLAEESFIEGGNNRVIVGSDGDFNVGPSSNEELVTLIESKRDAGIYLTVLGVGQGNLNDAMMEQLANNGNGTYEYIDNVQQLKKVFVYEKSKFYTVAKDCKIQIEFDSTKVHSYRLIGYENRVLENEEFETDSTDAGEIGASQTITALYELIMHEEVSYAAKVADVGLKYKKNESEVSTSLSYDISFNWSEFTTATEDTRFAASVAAFGMLLKNSEYSGSTTYDNIINWSDNARTFDPYGFRSEFVQLATKAKILE